jgi:hypothetical protein
MAPITGENFDAAQHLLNSCDVRHVAISYLGTAVIDGQHLFQFKNPPSKQIKPENMSYSNVFYTNDFEYVTKAKNMLETIWEKAHSPSALTIESLIRQASSTSAPPNVRKLDVKKTISNLKDFTFIGDAEASKTLTEKQVLHKAVSAEKVPAKDLFKEFSRIVHHLGLDCN